MALLFLSAFHNENAHFSSLKDLISFKPYGAASSSCVVSLCCYKVDNSSKSAGTFERLLLIQFPRSKVKLSRLQISGLSRYWKFLEVPSNKRASARKAQRSITWEIKFDVRFAARANQVTWSMSEKLLKNKIMLVDDVCSKLIFTFIITISFHISYCRRYACSPKLAIIKNEKEVNIDDLIPCYQKPLWHTIITCWRRWCVPNSHVKHFYSSNSKKLIIFRAWKLKKKTKNSNASDH